MFIRMLATRTGSEDGHVVRAYQRSFDYDVGDTLAKFFILSGWAQEIAPDIFHHTPH